MGRTVAMTGRSDLRMKFLDLIKCETLVVSLKRGLFSHNEYFVIRKVKCF